MRRLVSNSAVYGLGSVANQAVAFLLLPLYTRYLTPTDYGALALVNTAGSILIFTAALGIHSGMIRVFFQYVTPEERQRVASTALLFAATLAFLVGVSLILAGRWVVPLIFDFPNASSYYPLAVCTFCASAVNLTSLAILQVQQRPRAYVLASVSGVFVSVGVSIQLVAFARLGLFGVLVGQLAGVLTQLVIGLTASYAVIRGVFYAGALRRMLDFSVPLWPTNFSAWVLSMADRWTLKTFSTLASVGLYALGFRFGMILETLFVQPFQQAWSPHLFASLEDPGYREMIARALDYYVFVGAFIALGLGLFAGDAIRLIADPAFGGSEPIVFWIAVGSLLRGTSTVTVASIHIEGKTHYSAGVYVAATLLNLVLLRLLVPDFGIYGAAAALLVTYAAVTAMFLAIARRLHPIPYRLSRVFLGLVAAVSLYCASRLFPSSTDAASLGLKILLLASVPAVLLVAGYFPRGDLEAIRSALARRVARIRVR
ncbi:hypothetical protein MYXO_02398 [Myxococcaceae bacterium]|nr:hypothetical protein MYXO_02398 [Myxococcaceae bacterium]